MTSQDDTIAAIITPIGEGGVSVLRVSGKEAFAIADSGFKGKRKIGEVQSHTIHHGYFIDSIGNEIDEVLISVFKAPKTYTGENVVEISCHGSTFITRKILDELLILGCRNSLPGEFTMRAFLNGKIDLTQAEAIADLIKTHSDVSLQSSLRQLKGNFSTYINDINDKLLNICSLLELELDFSEEGLEFSDRKNIREMLETIIHNLTELSDNYQASKNIRDGIRVVICGEPNVGKSSLLNALLKRDRSIVTEISGTTRDIIEENLLLNGILFRLFDTAGIRDTEDIVEKEGIRKTEEEIENADIIIIMKEVGVHSTQTDKLFEKLVLKYRPNKKIVSIENKIDLVIKTDNTMNYQKPTIHTVQISAKTGEGMDSFIKQLVDIGTKGIFQLQENNFIITNSRHIISIKIAVETLRRGLDGIANKMSNEFIISDIRSAMSSLGEITGIITTDQILNNIFSKFCIGK